MNHIATQIQEHKKQVYVYMAILTGVIGILGTAISYFLGWGLTGTGGFLLFSGLINFVAYFFSDKLILRISRAKPLKKEDIPQLFEMVEYLTQKSGLPMPKVYLLEDSGMNAFATGRDHKHSAIAVTRGLLEKLTPEEVKAVLAHEIAHIKNYDMRVMAVVSILVGFLSILADMYWSSTIANQAEAKDQSGVMAWIGIILSVFAPISAFFIQLAISRKREYSADAMGAQLMGSGAPLASALEKISRHRYMPKHVSTVTAGLYFSSPYEKEGWLERLFSTHPPIQERITALRSM